LFIAETLRLCCDPGSLVQRQGDPNHSGEQGRDRQRRQQAEQEAGGLQPQQQVLFTLAELGKQFRRT
jgi:hypothetical protein